MHWIITKFSISILFSLVCAGKLLAGNSQYVGYQALTSATSGSQFYVQEPNWSDVTNSTRYINRQAFVKLVYTRNQHTNIKADANTPNPYWGVRYIFTTTDAITNQTKLDTLTLEHEQDTAVYEALAVHAISGGKILVNVTKVEARQGLGGAWTAFTTVVPTYLPASEIELQVIVNVDRYDYLSPTAVATASHFYTYSATTPKANHINISWSYVTGAESFELEYVYWDGLSTDNPGTGNPNKLFAHATRVETNAQNYKIDLTYPQGTLYYRVRPVGRHLGTPNNDMTYRKEGAWSSIGQLAVNAFETDKSWQYTTAFAEEGKSKKSISYFDESMRNRQSVVFLNDDQRTLVAETDYSVEGQQSIGILPVPASPQENNLFFKPAFNVNAAGQPYSYLDFDKNTNADPLGDISGAGHYYSSANSFVNDLYRDYIPQDAHPLTQTKFTRDNTGRVAAQGGIGTFFQLGSQHETQYYYGSATDVELRRLFGSNVGNAQHYDKNMVIDANGQVSITYADQTGKTIATALAGRAPSNVEALPSAGSAPITVDLIRNTTPTNGCIEDEASILNVEQGTVYDFSYNLTGTYNSLQMRNVNLCDVCQYRLEITIRNTEDEYILPAGTVSGANKETIVQGSDTLYRISQDYTGQQLANCARGTAYTTQPVDFQMTFNELGNYRINKRLCLVSEPLSALRQRLLTSGALPDSSAYIQAAYSQVDTTICDWVDTLTSAQQVAIVRESNMQYCESALLQIKQQVVPGAPFNIAAINAIAAMQNPPLYSIIDINGEQYFMAGNDIVDNTYNTVTSVTIANNQTGGIYTISNQSTMNVALQTPGIFQDSWADVLKLGHREYCHYWECQNLIPTRDYDFQLLQYGTWAKATVNGLNNYTAVLNNDPILSNTNFASCNIQPTLLGLMNNFRQSGQTIVQYVATAVNIANTASYSGNLSQSGQDSLSWSFFRGFYQNLRDSLLEACSSCSWYNDANTIFRQNGLRDIETVSAANNWNSEQLTIQYEQTCAAQVENWMQKFTHEMRLCGTYWNAGSNDSIYVRGQLAQYCSGNCDLENPMGIMLLEDATTDPYLQNALAHISSYFSNMSAPCDMNWYNNTLQAFDSVYTWSIDTTTGQYITVCVPSYSLQACPMDVIEWLNAGILGNIVSCGANQCQFQTTAIPGTCLQYATNILIDSSNNWFAANDKCKWLWLSEPPTQLVGNMPNTISTTFNIYNIDSIRLLFLRPITSSNPGISQTTPLLRLMYYTIQGDSGTIFLARHADCENITPCTTSRVATLKPVVDDNLSWNDVHQACINSLYETAFAEGMNEWNRVVDSLLSQYMRTVNNCWLPPMGETFTASYMSSEYHYTLYYYDQAGNLVQTISPEGVRPLTIVNGVWDGVSEPQHGLLVTYQFNTLGQTVRQTTPDGGTTVFYHDDLQRLRLSQNAEQALTADYAFITYDNLNRPVRAGKLLNYTIPVNSNIFNNNLNNLSFPTSNTTEETSTYYGYLANNTGYPQENLLGRISHVSNDNIITYYSYDEIGNIKQLWHKIMGMGTVNIAYQYDLVSGKVNQVDYQKGYQDQFSHRYNYDADNRLRSVETSADGYIWNREANYQYYTHGALARVELGDKVAGNDYYYNMQGWILGVNAMGEGEYHLGKDGQIANGTLNRWVARDAYSYQLAYYHKSYLPIGNYADYGISNDLISQTGTVPAGHTGQPGLYNGNISGMITQLAGGMLNGKVFAESFTYDQLHRIIGGVAGISAVSTDMGGFESSLDLHISNDFGTNYKYDANGNIKNLGRLHLGRPIDELAYAYNQLPSGMLEHNRLKLIKDAIGDAGVGDLGPMAGGYTYDAIGRLIEDPSESIKNIRWNIQDKVTHVQFTNGNPDVEYTYDAQGNRLMKNNGNTLSFYVRDAQGNVLAIYEKTNDGMIQKEVHLYGSSRLGSWYTNRTMDTQTVRKFNYTRGHRTYEQSNHLGNVLTTITDLAHGVDDNADKIAEYYAASVQYASLYYPFGWEIPALTYSATPEGNRYGFNGKENDKEWKIQDYGLRLYNQRIARFFAEDPLATGFPWLTPYQFAGNSPIKCIDLDGGEPQSHPNDWTFQEHHSHGTMFRTVDDFWVFEAHHAPTDRYIHYYYDNNQWQTFTPDRTSAYSHKGITNFMSVAQDEILEFTHTTLDIVGFAPGAIGTVADGWNVLIYGAQGDFRNAMWSGGGILLGTLGDMAKMGMRTKSVTKTHCAACEVGGKLTKCFVSGTVVVLDADTTTIEQISIESVVVSTANNSETSNLFVYDAKSQTWICITCEDNILHKLFKQFLGIEYQLPRIISKN